MSVPLRPPGLRVRVAAPAGRARLRRGRGWSARKASGRGGEGLRAEAQPGGRASARGLRGGDAHELLTGASAGCSKGAGTRQIYTITFLSRTGHLAAPPHSAPSPCTVPASEASGTGSILASHSLFSRSHRSPRLFHHCGGPTPPSGTLKRVVGVPVRRESGEGRSGRGSRGEDMAPTPPLGPGRGRPCVCPRPSPLPWGLRPPCLAVCLPTRGRGRPSVRPPPPPPPCCPS